ncbi:hypothetical protein GQ600_23882 [Phytophthora cactorum]|nr:hypothetical protein GQ600_23882 [Phytophthora cactorum]
MAEAPGQNRKHDKAPGARKRRRDVWGWLVKAGWTSKRPSSKSLDSRYKYVRPGGRHDGNEGDDYSSANWLSNDTLRTCTPSTSEGEGRHRGSVRSSSVTNVVFVCGTVAGVGRAVSQAVVSERSEHGTSEQEAQGTSRAAGAVADGSGALGNTAAGVVAVAGTRERSKRRDRAELNSLRAAASTFGTDGMSRVWALMVNCTADIVVGGAQNVAPVRCEKRVCGILDDQAADSSGANEDKVDELLDAFDETGGNTGECLIALTQLGYTSGCLNVVLVRQVNIHQSEIKNYRYFSRSLRASRTGAVREIFTISSYVTEVGLLAKVLVHDTIISDNSVVDCRHSQTTSDLGIGNILKLLPEVDVGTGTTRVLASEIPCA